MLTSVPQSLFNALNSSAVEGALHRVDAAEVDEMWSLVGRWRSNGSSHMSLITGQTQSWHVSTAGAKMKCVWSGKCCWSLVASHDAR